MRSSALLTLAFLAMAFQAFATGPDFVTRIQPMLELNCVRCHNDDKAKGGLRMHTFDALIEGGDIEEAVVPGDPTASEMLVRLHLRTIDEGVMPQKGRALEPEEVATLEA